MHIKRHHLHQLFGATCCLAVAALLCLSHLPRCDGEPVAVSVQVPSLLEILNPLTWINTAADATTAILTPTTCDQLDCPEYEVVDRLESNIELRSYSPSAWAATAVTDTDNVVDLATVVGTQRLLAYFSGRNDGDVDLPLTAPVLTIFRVDEDEQPQEDVVVAFYLPRKYQSAPGNNTSRKAVAIPTPADKRVQVVKLGSAAVYAVPFRSLPTPFRIRGLLRRSYDYLESVGEKDFDRSMCILAVYDRSALNLLGRSSELWILKKPAPPAPGAPAVPNNMTALANVGSSNATTPASAPAPDTTSAGGP